MNGRLCYNSLTKHKQEVYIMMNGMNSMMGGMGEKMMNRFFRKIDNVKWDLFTGRIGVATSEGIVTIEGEGEDAQIVLNLMDQFGMPVPAFAQNTPLNAVAVGDLIFQGNNIKGWVTEVVAKTTTTVDTDDATKPAKTNTEVKRFKLMTPSGTSTTWTPPKVSMLGFDSGVMVLRSLMNMLPGGESGLNSMQGMLMPMMMMGGDMDLEKLMPMMLFSQLGASGTGADAMGANGNMMQMMMMMQMMGGKGGIGGKGGKSGTGFFD